VVVTLRGRIHEASIILLDPLPQVQHTHLSILPPAQQVELVLDLRRSAKQER
jgi:hypothetical protein